MISEQLFRYQSINITYKFRKAQQDRKHLVVVFSSGFGGTYDFQGNFANSIRSNILWIKDEKNTYYIRDSNDFSMEEGVNLLIEKFRTDLGLDKNHCILLGASKGATGALYHAFKYNYPNVVASVPRMNMGSANLRERPDILAGLSKNGTAAEVEALDRLLLDELSGDEDLSKNVYLITSTADKQYKDEILPYLNKYSKYNNFNYILTRTPVVHQHSEVTRYNIPIISSIISALGEGIVPRYGWVRNGVQTFRSDTPSPTIENVQERKEAVLKFTSLKIVRNQLFGSGIAFIKGFPADKYGTVSTHISISGKNFSKSYSMGGVIDQSLSLKYFENKFCDYSVGAFANRSNKGIDLEDLDYGIYRIGLQVNHAGFERKYFEVPGSMRIDVSVHKDAVYVLEKIDSASRLTKRPVFGNSDSNNYFELVDFSTSSTKIHVEGYFAVQGVIARRWSSFSYYLLFADHSGKIVGSRKLVQASRTGVSNLINDPWNDYSKAYFATPKYDGIELPQLPEGSYWLSVSLITNDSVYTRDLELTLVVSSSDDGKRSVNLSKTKDRADVEAVEHGDSDSTAPMTHGVRTSHLRSFFHRFTKRSPSPAEGLENEDI